jgi:hypothetical protein
MVSGIAKVGAKVLMVPDELVDHLPEHPRFDAEREYCKADERITHLPRVPRTEYGYHRTAEHLSFSARPPSRREPSLE